MIGIRVVKTKESIYLEIEKLIQERQKWLTWKNIIPRREALDSIGDIPDCSVRIEDAIEIDGDFDEAFIEKITEVAHIIKPWRKGPFKIGKLFIDSEWRSFIKYDLLKPHFDLKDKVVADVGCNNGYYMFKMLKENPTKIIGFDPSPIMMTQFDFINKFVKSDIRYELLGIEHIKDYKIKFDVIFCLGVLYHRSDPISALKSLKAGLNKNGELILDTFMIDGEDETCLIPKDRYSKIPNIYFIPTIHALKNWCNRAGFSSIEVLEITTTSTNEQRMTPWIISESLNDFLDQNNPNLTVEGYPAPKRVYVKVRV